MYIYIYMSMYICSKVLFDLKKTRDIAPEDKAIGNKMKIVQLKIQKEKKICAKMCACLDCI